MSEVTRYAVERPQMYLHIEGRTLGTEERVVVLAADFDTTKEELTKVKAGYKWESERAALQLETLNDSEQSLAAANERVAVLVTALSRIKFRLDAFVGADRDMPSPSVEVCKSIADAALAILTISQLGNSNIHAGKDTTCNQ